jgi:hypothetical protein
VSNKHLTITEIVSTVYCEQKMLLDRERGDATPSSVREKAVQGTIEHRGFERQGQIQSASDRRCFVASALYGPCASETDFLRDWRDQSLSKTAKGRLLIRVYYALSPYFVRFLVGKPRTTEFIRYFLSQFIRSLKLNR